jgi:hypothetical protein
MKGRHVVILIFVFGLSLMAILFRVLGDAKPPPAPVKVAPPVDWPPPPPAPHPPPNPQTSGVLEVLVKMKGAPVQGATVSFQFVSGTRSLQTVTDQAGKSGVPLAEPGAWRIFARSSALAAAVATATVETGKTTIVELDLAAGVRIEGTVRDAAGNPVPGSRITMSLPDPVFSARTDSTGRYVIADVPVGTHSFTATSERLRPDTKTNVELTTPGQAVTLDFLLKTGAFVVGRVTDEAGAPVARATVTVSNEVARQVRSDENGDFRAEGLGEGPITMSVVARGYGPASQQGLTPGGPPVVIKMSKGAILEGQIDGDPVSFSVHVSRLDEVASRWVVARSMAFSPQAKGVFQIRDLAAGQYEIVIEATDNRRTPAPLALRLESGQELKLGLVPLAAK